MSLNISRTREKYFRGCTVSNNEELVSKITQLFDKDLPRSVRSQDLTNSGSSRFRSMIIINNGEEIYIGLSYTGAKGCYLFISGPQSAFK